MIRRIRAEGLEPFVVNVRYDTGQDYVLPLVESGAVTAVMCPTDMRQLQYLRALSSNGIDVPRQVSVTGCDGFLPGMGVMGLTTYTWPIGHFTDTVIDTMIDLIKRFRTPDDRREVVSVKFEGEVVAGATVAPPPL